MILNVDGEPRLTTSRPTDPAEETGRQPLVILAASEQRAMLLQQLFTQAATAYNPARRFRSWFDNLTTNGVNGIVAVRPEPVEGC